MSFRFSFQEFSPPGEGEAEDSQVVRCPEVEGDQFLCGSRAPWHSKANPLQVGEEARGRRPSGP